jgi:putative transposase
LAAAARYVALNPVRARLVACAQDWAWSSARAHLAGRDDALVRVAPPLDRVGRSCDLIDSDTDHVAFAALRAAESTGRAQLGRVRRYAGACDGPPPATAKAGAQAERTD